MQPACGHILHCCLASSYLHAPHHLLQLPEGWRVPDGPAGDAARGATSHRSPALLHTMQHKDCVAYSDAIPLMTQLAAVCSVLYVINKARALQAIQTHPADIQSTVP